MTQRRWAAGSFLSVAALCATVTGAGCGHDHGDLATFCVDYRTLADDNPFATLEVASPGEMRTAFKDLSDAADAVESSAPEGLDRLASDYSNAIETLVEVLSATEFDPRNLDTAAYRRATIDYAAAATALSNETVARCE